MWDGSIDPDAFLSQMPCEEAVFFIFIILFFFTFLLKQFSLSLQVYVFLALNSCHIILDTELTCII